MNKNINNMYSNRNKPSQKVVLPSHKATFLSVFTHFRTVEPFILNPLLHSNLQILPNLFPHCGLVSFPLLGAERRGHLNTVNKKKSIPVKVPSILFKNNINLLIVRGV